MKSILQPLEVYLERNPRNVKSHINTYDSPMTT